MARRGIRYKPTEADREFVRRAIVAGTSVDETADAMNLTDDTLRKHFRFEIMTARETLKGKAVKTLEDALEDGSLDAAKFVLARRAGWSEKSEHDLRSSDGSMSQTSIDASRLSDAVLQELLNARKATDTE